MLPMQVNLIGIHSRSKKHVSASRDFDRKRISFQDYAVIQEREAVAYVEEQKRYGFSFASDGQFLWQDLLRPFAESPGMNVGPLSRWFETNTFYRKPFAEEGKSCAEGFDAGVLDKYLVWKCAPSIAFLPGPFSFHILSENVSIEDSSKALHKASFFLAEKGVSRIVFSEPALGYNSDTISSGEWAEIRRAFENICSRAHAALQAETIVHVYYGPCPRRAFSLPVSGLAVDLFEEQDLRDFPDEKLLGLGAVDATSTLLESPGEVVAKVKETLAQSQKHEGREGFFLCPNQAFDYIPRLTASQKMSVLSEAAKMLQTS